MDERLDDYRQICGQLCMLAGQLLHNQVNSKHVRAAMSGDCKVNEVSLLKIVALRKRADVEIKVAVAGGCLFSQVIDVTRELRCMAEREWDTRLPIVAGHAL